MQTISNLSEYFEQLTSKYNKLKREQIKSKRKQKEIDDDFQLIGEQIRKIITPVMIRRSRIDLKKIKVYWDDLEKLGISVISKDGKFVIDNLKWNGLAKKIGLSLDDQITEFKVENLNRPNKAIVYPFAFLVLFVFGYLNYRRKPV